MKVGYDLIVECWIAITLGLGGILFYHILQKERLVPPFLAIWGLFGAVGVGIGGVLEAYGTGLGTYFAIPIALNEPVLGIWLMIRGGSVRTPATVQDES